MNRKSSAKFVAGAMAAVLFMGAAPQAEARNGLRSAQALPSMGAMRSFNASSSLTAFSPGRSTQAFGSVSATQRTSAFSLPGLIFSFLPGRIQDTILGSLANRPRGERLCAILGIPGCVRNDSPG